VSGEPADIGRPALRQTYLVSYASINSIRFNGTRYQPISALNRAPRQEANSSLPSCLSKLQAHWTKG